MSARVIVWAMAGALIAVAGCGDDEEPLCTPGAVRTCLCSDGSTLGEQTCNDDERTQSTCAPCPAGMGGGGQGGTTSTGGSGGN